MTILMSLELSCLKFWIAVGLYDVLSSDTSFIDQYNLIVGGMGLVIKNMQYIHICMFKTYKHYMHVYNNYKEVPIS